jgi:hypothetical protein
VHPVPARAQRKARAVDVRRPMEPVVAKPRSRSPDFSLESSFDRLAADADRGDRFASCLLSRALALCEDEERMRDEEQYWMQVAVESERNSWKENFAVSRISRHGDSVVQAAALCKGLSSGRLNEAAPRMLQAAMLGDPHAMAHFALYSQPADGAAAAREEYDKLYLDNAVVMLERSASMGNLRAMRSLYEVYLHGVSPNRSDAMRVEKDPVSAIAIGMVLMQKVAPDEKEYLAATMAQVGDRSEVLGSDRYASLLRKYSAYMDAISMRGFDESGRNMDIASCRQYR